MSFTEKRRRIFYLFGRVSGGWGGSSPVGGSVLSDTRTWLKFSTLNQRGKSKRNVNIYKFCIVGNWYWGNRIYLFYILLLAQWKYFLFKLRGGASVESTETKSLPQNILIFLSMDFHAGYWTSCLTKTCLKKVFYSPRIFSFKEQESIKVWAITERQESVVTWTS